MLSGDTYGAMVAPHTSLSKGNIPRAAGMAEAGRHLGKPVCFSYSGGWIGGPSVIESEMNPNLQCFQSIDRCFATLAAWHKREDRLLAYEKHGPRKLSRLSPAGAAATAAQLIGASNNRTLTEREAKAVLAAYGVPVVQEQLVQLAADAARAAQQLGFPVVLKVESPDSAAQNRTRA